MGQAAAIEEGRINNYGIYSAKNGDVSNNLRDGRAQGNDKSNRIKYIYVCSKI
jgi:hypothetical protein